MNKFLFLLLLSLVTFASADDAAKVFDYTGQEVEEVQFEEVKEVTLYKTEYVDGTCTRQEPYVVNECGYETRYREECHWEPARDHCYYDSDYVCHNVTRYRNDCTTGPSRQDCSYEPSRTVCRTRNGEQRCRDVPGRRVCRTIPGSRTCNRVAYTDRECDTVQRRICDTIPGQNVCKDVPYQEYVCKDVTKYKTVEYACQKPVEVPYQAEKKFVNNVKFEFVDKKQIGSAIIKTLINELDVLIVEIKNTDKDKTYIQATSSKEVEVDTDQESIINTTYKVKFGSKQDLLAPLKTPLLHLWINKGGKLKLTTDKSKLLDKVKFEFDIKKRNNTRIYNKKHSFSDFTVTTKGEKKELFINLGKHGFKRQRTTFGTALKLDVFVRLAVKTPKDLVDPIGQSLFVVKKFKVKAYKNK